MFDRLDPRSPTPLYAQIADAIRVGIVAGELADGDGLPSVRALAAELRVNPATVVQAYRDLEAGGLVEMRQGAGTFVRALPDERRARERLDDARRLIRTLLVEAGRQGLTAADLRNALEAEAGEIA